MSERAENTLAPGPTLLHEFGVKLAVIAGSIVLERIVRVALARAIRSKPVTGQALALHGHG